MSVFVFIRFFLECAAVGLVCYAVYREKDLIRFERKVWKYTKAFFKAAYFSIGPVAVPATALNPSITSTSNSIMMK